MKRIRQHLLIIATVLAVIVSCSKDDDGGSTPINADGGEVITSQLVKVKLPDTELSEEEYDGTFGQTPVKLLKTGEFELTFYTPSNEIGDAVLNIPALNATIRYISKQGALNGSTDEVISALKNNLAAFSATLGDDSESNDLKVTLNNFNIYYDNLTDEEKKQAALFYQTNKILIDGIILNNPVAENGRITADDIFVLKKFSFSIGAAGLGVAIVVLPSGGVEKILGATIAAVGCLKAKAIFNDLSERKLNTVSLIADKIMEGSDRRAGSLSLKNDVSSTFSFNSEDRKVIASDAAATSTGIMSYFKDINKYNYWVGRVNSAINTLNNIPFVNIKLVPIITLSSSSPTENKPVNTETFGKIQFSINNPNLSLVSASLLQTGQLSLKVKIIGDPATTPVASKLNYTYSDSFSAFSGSFDIEVEDTSGIDLSGTWAMSFVMGSGTCDEILIVDEGSSTLNVKFNDDNTITFLTDPADLGLNGPDFNQIYTLTDDVLLITVSDPDGRLILKTNVYNNANQTFTGTYINTWLDDDAESCTNTFTITKN